MPEPADLIPRVVDMSSELDRRIKRYRQLEQYVDPDGAPIPPAIARAQVTQAYRMLMQFAQTNYARLIVRAATSRLEVGGVRSGDPAADRAVWGHWQENRLDADSRLAHDTALTHGRAFAIVWPNGETPTITIEPPTTTIVEYVEGSRHERAAGLRRWMGDDKRPHATLYTPAGVFKFSGPRNSSGSAGTRWEPRLVEGEPWPLEPLAGGVVPVVEIAANRRLVTSKYGHAEGDFENVLGLLDRINVLEFLRLVIGFTSGFPIRAVIGDRILRDDTGKPIAPFKLAADVIAQFENPDVKLTELKATDLKGFGDAIDRDVETLAGITQTPSYYLRSLPIQNVSVDAIRAAEMPLTTRVADHRPQLGEGWEETLRVSGQLAETPAVLDARAELSWVNREARTLSERADAAVKLAAVMPWPAVAELVFDATDDELNRWEAMRASDTLGGLLNPPPAPGA